MKDICFQMNRKAWIVMLFALCLTFPALAQKITVQGAVVDGTGEPLIGASVIPQGTTTGTATDFDGKFQLDVAPNATLVVSYVGYETQNVPVKGQNIIAKTKCAKSENETSKTSLFSLPFFSLLSDCLKTN